MHFENRTVVPISRERLWDFLGSMENVAQCAPGVEGFADLGDDRYAATLKIRLGPISLRLVGQVQVLSRDRSTWTAAMRARGDEAGVGGSVTASITLVLAPGDSGSTTELAVITDADVLGRLGEFGQPVMRHKADGLMRDFVRNLVERVAADPGQPESVIGRRSADG